MIITLSPVRMSNRYSLARAGDALIIDGETFDFSALPEGATLPADAVASDWIVGPVERIDGVLHLTLILPHGDSAPQETRFPAPITLTAEGPVTLPPHDAAPEDEA